MSQSAKDVVGPWMLVSADAEQGGNKVEVLGPNPKGFMILGSDGRYAIQQYRSGLPKFASNVRDKGTPEENKAVVQGSISHYGTYAVNEADKTIVFRIEVSSFPNFNGTEQKRAFTLAGDELAYTTPGSSSFGTARVTWKRAK